jgi:hypothetical protein
LYTATTKIDDVAPHQQKPPQKPPTTAKTTEGVGVKSDGFDCIQYLVL